MVQHTNFYETIQEARMRLDETIVLYDELPYHVLCVCDHNPDGVFRAYLDPVSEDGKPYHRQTTVPYTWFDEPGMNRGQKMDQWLDSTEGKTSPVIRKKLNSPKFNKFRPFPLGMVNKGSQAVYSERSPTRHTQQGLTGASISAISFDIVSNPSVRKMAGPVDVSIYSPGLYNTIVGDYPDLDLVLTNLTDESVVNTSTGFCREFAIVRGPMNLLFMAYKGEIVGFLPANNTSEVKISPKHSYIKEVIDELACFNKIS